MRSSAHCSWPTFLQASTSTVSSYDSDQLFSPASSSEARTSTQCSPFPKEISLFPNAEEPDHSDSDSEEGDSESYWWKDPNASSVSLASITSSVLSFYRLQTPPQSLLDGYVNDEHLMKRASALCPVHSDLADPMHRHRIELRRSKILPLRLRMSTSALSRDHRPRFSTFVRLDSTHGTLSERFDRRQ